MKIATSTCVVLFWTVILVFLFAEQRHKSNTEFQPAEVLNRTKEAYVALVFGDYNLGTRVLGQSLRETNTTRDYVAMCTETVTDKTKQVLQADGWIIKKITGIPNPYGDKTFFSGTYSKLNVWNMTEYERVVYMDSDTLVVSNIDHAFSCGTFCAAYEYTEGDRNMFNSGFMVIEPSTSVFNNLVKQIPFLPSYDKGDQGFLNAYFKDLVYAPFFNWSESRRQHHHMRLPTGLNTISIFTCLKSAFKIKESELKVIHYAGLYKPWKWWTHRVLDFNWKWVDVRKRLPPRNTTSDYHLLYWAPYLLMFTHFIILRSVRKIMNKNFVLKSKIGKTRPVLKKLTQYISLSMFLLSYLLSSQTVPSQMLPSHGEYLLWLWSSFFFFLFMSSYCCVWSCTLHIHTTKLLKTAFLFAIFTLSHFSSTLPPYFGTLLSCTERFMLIQIMLLLQILTCAIIGERIMHVWTE